MLVNSLMADGQRLYLYGDFLCCCWLGWYDISPRGPMAASSSIRENIRKRSTWTVRRITIIKLVAKKMDFMLMIHMIERSRGRQTTGCRRLSPF